MIQEEKSEKCSVFVSHCESTQFYEDLTCLYLGNYWEINRTLKKYNSIQSFADGDIVSEKLPYHRKLC